MADRGETLQVAGEARYPDIAALGPWFHNLHLPDGRQTAPDHPLGDFPAFKWAQLRASIPADLSGWRVLDIGCNAGYYSFELARRGAQVVGIDHDEHYLEQARWAASLMGLEQCTEFRRLGLYELAAEDERYDLILFMGVFYHLRYPLLALDLVASRVKRLLLFQTLTSPGDEAAVAGADLRFDQRERMSEPGWPKMAFIEHALAGDPTNWWAPNCAGARAMLRSAGLRVLAEPAHETWLCEPAGDGPSDIAAAQLAEVRQGFTPRTQEN